MKQIILVIVLSILAFQFNAKAQITSELKNNELQIIDSAVPMMGANYSLNNFRIQEDFNFVSGILGTLSAGTDLRQSSIAEFGLTVSENLTVPSRFSTFGIDALSFNYFNSGNNATDNWSIFTSNEGSDRRSLSIVESFGSDAIASEVGLYLAPWELLEGGINVGVGTTTPSEKLEVDGAIKVNEETFDPQPNVLYGNSMPIAYGVYNQIGCLSNLSYGVTSISQISPGRYTLTIDNSVVSNNIFFTATMFDTNQLGFISYFPPNGNTIEIRTTDINGNDANRSFSFAVYGTPQ